MPCTVVQGNLEMDCWHERYSGRKDPDHLEHSRYDEGRMLFCFHKLEVVQL